MGIGSRSRAPLALLSFVLLLPPGCARKSAVPRVFIAADASWHERAAASEIRRYLFLRTGELPEIREVRSFARVPARSVAVLEKGGSLSLGLDDAETAAKIAGLGPEDYWLKTLPRRSARTVLVAGGSGPAVLYGAYQLAEKLGVRFALEGDVVPDARVAAPELDLDETGRPLFPVRGIQPFHDFPEGPDWWNTDDYLAVIGQLPKLRMNFFGLQTYPENAPNAELTTWIGVRADIGEGREVLVSRGELVEIGGSFRMPDVMRMSGAVLREVGTTNKTHLRDYEEAVNEDFRNAAAAGVRLPPTLFVNGILFEGARTMQALQARVDSLL